MGERGDLARPALISVFSSTLGVARSQGDLPVVRAVAEAGDDPITPIEALDPIARHRKEVHVDRPSLDDRQRLEVDDRHRRPGSPRNDRGAGRARAVSHRSGRTDRGEGECPSVPVEYGEVGLFEAAGQQRRWRADSARLRERCEEAGEARRRRCRHAPECSEPLTISIGVHHDRLLELAEVGSAAALPVLAVDQFALVDFTLDDTVHRELPTWVGIARQATYRHPGEDDLGHRHRVDRIEGSTGTCAGRPRADERYDASQ